MYNIVSQPAIETRAKIAPTGRRPSTHSTVAERSEGDRNIKRLQFLSTENKLIRAAIRGHRLSKRPFRFPLARVWNADSSVTTQYTLTQSLQRRRRGNNCRVFKRDFGLAVSGTCSQQHRSSSLYCCRNFHFSVCVCARCGPCACRYHVFES